MWCVVMGAVALASEVEVSDEDSSASSNVPLAVTPKQSLNRAMWTLNTWAITNIATGVPLSLTLEDPQQAAFYQMNAGWNAINLGLATMSLAKKDAPVDPEKWSRIFWINAGLDVGYVATGLYMAHRGRETGNPQMEGWGNSMALQGDSSWDLML